MRGRLLVVSHACVLPANQGVVERLAGLGWEPTLVVPRRWRHEYAAEPFAAAAAPGLEGALRPLPVALAGRPQRHLYLASASRLLRELRPDAAFVEEEPFSVPAFQWSAALARAGVPFGVHTWENLDRPLPAVARAIRRQVLRRAGFVAARSPAAVELVRRLGARGEVALAPHGVRPQPHAAAARRNGRFTVGFAGRLVPEKGVLDLASAARLAGGMHALFVGDGPLRVELERSGARVLTGVSHDDMPDAFAQMDVLVLPSRTTRTWKEQFGRVLVEALACGVPVVGSDSGAIPWVIGTTGGGLVFPEGDERALAAALGELRDDPGRREALAAHGRRAVEERFTFDTAAAALDELLLHAQEARAHG